MRTLLLTTTLLGLALAPAGCKKTEKKANEEKPGEPAPPDDSAKEAPPEKEHGSGTGGGMGGGTGAGASEMTNKMKHCPSAVEGSVTKVQLNKGAVVVTVTATDAAKVAEIQKRAKH